MGTHVPNTCQIEESKLLIESKETELDVTQILTCSESPNGC